MRELDDDQAPFILVEYSIKSLKTKLPTVLAYRGYLIKTTLLGTMFVERGGFLICWAASLADAQAQIDKIA